MAIDSGLFPLKMVDLSIVTLVYQRVIDPEMAVHDCHWMNWMMQWHPEALTASCFVMGADLSEWDSERIFCGTQSIDVQLMCIDVAKLPSAFVRPPLSVWNPSWNLWVSNSFGSPGLCCIILWVVMIQIDAVAPVPFLVKRPNLTVEDRSTPGT